MFEDLPRTRFAAIYADPPWAFDTYGSQANSTTDVNRHYETMALEDIKAMPVSELAAPDCVLFLWVTWPTLERAIDVINAWGFTYKTCAFAWMKANGKQIDLFHEDVKADMTTGYWTRSNSEVCLLATVGKPHRVNADVRQGIIEPRRQHSRKPSCVYDRIERLVAGPYLELFARTARPGWTSWGNQVGKFAETTS